MHRRGNKSKKVPNVRLRPAHPDAMARARTSPEHTSCWAEDSQIGSDDTAMIVGSCPRPFKGVVVCATGVLDKPALFKLALELGATSVSAFTDRVTHLVAEDHGGAKYMCAIERKIPILLPSWIIESHRIWQHGDDVDLAQSVAAHRLPVFSGITLCVSGIPEILRRTQINKLLTARGGTYVKNLERPVRVTHLLCAGDAETDKMRYAEKFNRAGEADPPIQLVWEEWFWDSLEFGGRFDEGRYQARLPRPERKTVPEGHAAPANASVAPPDDDADEDELASVQHVPEMTLQLWSSLLKARGYEIARGAPALDTSAATARAPDEGPGSGSVLSSFRRQNSFVAPDAAGPSRLPFRHAASSAGPVVQPSTPVDEEGEDKDAEPASTVFTGLTFRLRGETDTATVQSAITGAGGALATEDGEYDYVVVRLVSGSVLYRTEADPFVRERYRTECWLERCLFEDRLCAPDAHVSFVPIGVRLPVPGAERITLSFSGLDASEACWVKRLLKALGITLASTFSRHTTHLLCPSGVGVKYDKARQWGVPVVGMGWLEAMVQGGGVPDIEGHLPNRSLLGTQRSSAPPPPTTPSPPKRRQTATPSRSRSATSTPLELVAHPVPTQASSNGSAKSIRRAVTLGEVARGRGRMETRVPSSSSPSPLRRGVSVSPSKIPGERTKALQESIASLLGKRQTSLEDEDSGTRPGKRGRPHRSKPQSRQPSGVVEKEPELELDMLPAFGARSMSPGFEGLQVMYEDPGQQEELQRLTSLIGDPVEETKKRPRRSARRAGL
ncbi:hypothetical protein B0H10DRAFT_2150634 [Mycena sp. CBHHK59/15]|nr:hypothetical protein B0H10DRAFT_2150634 [Mycena sp. CBHHK59/15]